MSTDASKRAAAIMLGKAKPARRAGDSTQTAPRTRSGAAKPAPDQVAREGTDPGKTTRVTVDLDAERYAALNRWLASAAPEVSPDARRVSLARAVRAMIDVTTRDKDITLVVLDQLRRDLLIRRNKKDPGVSARGGSRTRRGFGSSGTTLTTGRDKLSGDITCNPQHT